MHNTLQECEFLPDGITMELAALKCLKITHSIMM